MTWTEKFNMLRFYAFWLEAGFVALLVIGSCVFGYFNERRKDREAMERFRREQARRFNTHDVRL